MVKSECVGSVMYHRFSGIVDLSEVMNVQIADHRSPDYEKIRYVIADFSECEDFTSNPLTFSKIVAHDIGASLTNPHISIICVTSNPAVIDFMISKQEMAGCFPVEIVATMQDAERWLEQHGR